MSKIKITLVKSVIGYDKKVRETAKSLGLGKLHSSACLLYTSRCV